MIVFDLKCAHGHVFEAWFGSSAAFAEQRARGLVACPSCGETDVAKAVMAPNIAIKGNNATPPVPAASERSGPATPGQPLPPEAMKAALQSLAEAQARVLEKSQWVGRSFADRARAMHAGEEISAPIHGQSTAAEARALVEDGVPIAPLLIPVVPPEQLN